MNAENAPLARSPSPRLLILGAVAVALAHLPPSMGLDVAVSAAREDPD